MERSLTAPPLDGYQWQPLKQFGFIRGGKPYNGKYGDGYVQTTYKYYPSDHHCAYYRVRAKNPVGYSGYSVFNPHYNIATQKSDPQFICPG